MDTIDDDLPFIMNIFLSEAFEMLGTLVVLVISQPLLAVAFVPLAFIYRWIQVGPHASSAAIMADLYPICTLLAKVCVQSAEHCCKLKARLAYAPGPLQALMCNVLRT